MGYLMKIILNKFEYCEDQFQRVADLLRNMVNKDWTKRISADQALDEINRIFP